MQNIERKVLPILPGLALRGNRESENVVIGKIKNKKVYLQVLKGFR
jgi:hypothetical protein